MQNQIRFNSYIPDQVKKSFMELAPEIPVDVVVGDEGRERLPVVWLIDQGTHRDYIYFHLCPETDERFRLKKHRDDVPHVHSEIYGACLAMVARLDYERIESGKSQWYGINFAHRKRLGWTNLKGQYILPHPNLATSVEDLMYDQRKI